MNEPEEKTRPTSSHLRRALLAQEYEIKRLEDAIRALRDRHVELRAALGEEPPSPGTADGARSELMTSVGEVPHAEGSEGKHAQEARRFARLLVSEIALYHPEQVEEGRRHRDLYARLKISIDRSRQAYDQRFGKSAAGAADFFYDELVKSLAGNDPALLGAGYPSPAR
jgi:hypothetical protein